MIQVNFFDLNNALVESYNTMPEIQKVFHNSINTANPATIASSLMTQNWTIMRNGIKYQLKESNLSNAQQQMIFTYVEMTPPIAKKGEEEEK